MSAMSAISAPLEEYLAALDARDVREQAHADYIHAYTRLADRTATPLSQPRPSADPAAPSPSLSARSTGSNTPKGKQPAKPDSTPPPSGLAQIRAELASTQKTRSELETKLSTISAELGALKATDAEQKKRIAQLEKIKEHLERRVKDRADELKGKGRFVEEVQDEMLALELQLSVAEQEKEKLRQENEQLTRRWVEKMEQEARALNESNDQKWIGRG